MSTVYTGKFRLWRISDWEKLPAMRWFIKGIIVRYGTMLLFGLPKTGKKSFNAISMACSIATGKNWCGLATQKGKVLYIVGEGFYGLLRRQAAWEKLHGCKCGDNLRFFRVPVNFFNAVEVNIALAALKAQGFEPDFIVIDTLARSMGGGKENDTENMNRVFDLIENFRLELKTDGMILVIAHTTKHGFDYRGSSVQGGAVDGLILSESAEGSNEIKLISKGFKDAAGFGFVKVYCEAVKVETEDGSEEVLAIKDRVKAAIPDEPSEIERHARGLVRIMREQFTAKGATNGELLDKFKESGMKESTFHSALNCASKEKGWLVGGGGRGKRYKLNPDESWKEAVGFGGDVSSITSLHFARPLTGNEANQSDKATSIEANLELVRSKVSDKISNEINEPSQTNSKLSGEDDFEQSSKLRDRSLELAEGTEPPKSGIDPLSKAAELLNRRNGGSEKKVGT